MTVSTTKASDVFPGNGVTTGFDCEWRIFDETDVLVSLVDQSTGDDTPLVRNTDYTISGAGDQEGFTVGTVSPVATGTSLYVRRSLEYKQPTDFTNQGAFFPTMHEDAMDRLEMQIQQQVDGLDRSLKANAVTGDYDAGGGRLVNIADGDGPNDAASVQQVSQAVAAAQITPAVPAADIALLSNLASVAAGKGASLIGYLTGTVKSFLDSLSSDLGATYIKYKASFTGAIQRTLGAAAEDQINSAWFGPDETGNTACSSKLQAALDAAAGKTLVIKPGTYLLDASLLVSSFTTVYAEGATFYRIGTLDNLIRNKSDGTVGGYTANQFIKIIGGTWDSTAGPGSPSGNCTVLAFGHCSNIWVERARIINENSWHHIEFNNSQRCMVRGCYLSGGYAAAVAANYIGNEAIQIDSFDASSRFPWFGPYDAGVCQHIIITGNVFYSVGNGPGTHGESASVNHQDIHICDNVFDTVYYSCVKPLTWSAFRVRGNRMENCAYGVNVQQNSSRSPNDFEISGNSIYSVGGGSYASESRGIKVAGTSTVYATNFRISNNSIISVAGQGTYGITVDYGRYGQITGNNIDTVARSGIYAYAACQSVVIANNTVTNEDTTGGTFRGIRIGNLTGNLASRMTVVGNYCRTLNIAFAQDSFVTNNNILTSVDNSNNTRVTVVNNLIGTTWA